MEVVNKLICAWKFCIRSCKRYLIVELYWVTIAWADCIPFSKRGWLNNFLCQQLKKTGLSKRPDFWLTLSESSHTSKGNTSRGLPVKFVRVFNETCELLKNLLLGSLKTYVRVLCSKMHETRMTWQFWINYWSNYWGKSFKAQPLGEKEGRPRQFVNAPMVRSAQRHDQRKSMICLVNHLLKHVLSMADTNLTSV